MADLGETLLRALAPIQQGRLKRQEADTASQDKLNYLKVLSGGKIDLEKVKGENAIDLQSAKGKTYTEVQKYKADQSLQAAMERAKASMAAAAARNPNDPRVLKYKAANAIVNQRPENGLIYRNTDSYKAAMKTLYEFAAPAMPSDDDQVVRGTAEQSFPGISGVQTDNFLDQIQQSPEYQTVLQMNPEFAATMDLYNRSKMPQTPLQPVGQPPVNNGTQQPSSGTSVTQPQGGNIRVRNKQTGQTGSIPAGNFNSTKYDRIQ